MFSIILVLGGTCKLFIWKCVEACLMDS